MAGKIELLTPSNGKVALVGEDTATDVTVTVPAVTATMLNDQSDIEAQVKTATNATGDAPIYSCRAWCNFSGTGTVAIRGSGNVSSITDDGVGIYTLNFTTAMPDANYSVVGSGNDFVSTLVVSTRTLATGGVGIRLTNTAITGDNAEVCVAIFR